MIRLETKHVTVFKSESQNHSFKWFIRKHWLIQERNWIVFTNEPFESSNQWFVENHRFIQKQNQWLAGYENETFINPMGQTWVLLNTQIAFSIL